MPSPLPHPIPLRSSAVPNMSASALLKSRIARPSYLKKLAKAEDLIEHFPHGSYIVSASHCGCGAKQLYCNTIDLELLKLP